MQILEPNGLIITSPHRLERMESGVLIFGRNFSYLPGAPHRNKPSQQPGRPHSEGSRFSEGVQKVATGLGRQPSRLFGTRPSVFSAKKETRTEYAFHRQKCGTRFGSPIRSRMSRHDRSRDSRASIAPRTRGFQTLQPPQYPPGTPWAGSSSPPNFTAPSRSGLRSPRSPRSGVEPPSEITRSSENMK